MLYLWYIFGLVLLNGSVVLHVLQILFGVLYIINLAMILVIYIKTEVVCIFLLSLFPHDLLYHFILDGKL